MPTTRTLLIFDLDDALFGVDATLVSETVWLPALTPVEEAPPYIVGLFSLRGHIVPVADLHLRFSHPARPYRLSDQIVVLELDRMLMGVIVSEVREVIEIASDAIQPPPRYDEKTPRQTNLIIGEVRIGDDIILLLDVSQLMHQPQGLAETDTEQMSPTSHFCPQATPEQHAVFLARARALMEVAIEEGGEYLKLAVVMLGDEYFGIELHAMQEFCEIPQLSPIPCCPPHILGAINLRGDLLTVLDLRAALHLPHATKSNGKAVVASASNWIGTDPSTKLRTCFGDQSVGVAVDEVCDVVYLRHEELLEAPQTLREHHGAEIKGVAPFAGRMMAVLDLPALLAREEWIVNETV